MKKNIYGKLCILDGVIYKKKFWFIVAEIPALFAYDFCLCDAECYEIPGYENVKTNALFRGMERIGDEIYLVPFFAKEVVVFNVEALCFGKIFIEKKYLSENGTNYMASAVFESFLYLFGVDVPYIIRIDVRRGEIDKAVKLTASEYKQKNEDVYFRKQMAVVGNMIYIPFCNMPAILKMDIASMEYLILRIPEDDCGYSGILYINNEFWLSPRRNEALTIWSEETNEVRHIDNASSDKELSYAGLEEIEGNICLFPMKKRERGFEGTVCEKDGIYNFVRRDNGYLLYYEMGQGMLSVIYNDAGIKKHDAEIIYKKYISAILDRRKSIYEGAYIDLDDYIQLIKKEEI